MKSKLKIKDYKLEIVDLKNAVKKIQSCDFIEIKNYSLRKIKIED